METKRCYKCGLTKPVDKFHKNKARYDGLNTLCKSCNNAKANAWAIANPGKNRDKQRRDRLANPRHYFNGYLKRLYGITLAQYDEMLRTQNNLCAICQTDTPGRGLPSFVVDHCHDTGRVRGLLCHHCNLALGHFKDNPVLLKAAQGYLEALK